MTRLTRVSKIGLVLLALGLIPWASWTVWDSTRTWFLLKDMPISLSNGSHYGTGFVRTNMNALYSIDISADYSGPIDVTQPSKAATKIACQIGVNDSNRGCQTPPLWKFHWILSDDGNIIHGNSDETTGQGWISGSGRINRELGTFRTKSGHRYKFDLKVLFDNHDAKIVNPHLTVGVADYHTESSLFLTGLIRLICAPIVIIGLLLALGSQLSQWLKRKRDLAFADDQRPRDVEET